MIRILTALLVALAPAPSAARAQSCAGPNPAITSLAVKDVTTSGNLNTYHLDGTVTNLGTQGQPSNTLQFVDIYIDTQKRNDRGIPPLAPGQSYNFGFDWTRSSDAGPGTTTARFRLRMVQGSDCNPANGVRSIKF
jgi:hypothetical protein